jgi:hypothetical protein
MINKAVDYFTGNNNQEQDRRNYKTWYDEKILKHLVHSQAISQPNKSSMLPYVFNVQDELSFDEQIKEQLEQLMILRTELQQDICFIMTQIGNNAHFICGILTTTNELLLVDPTGLVKRDDFYEKLSALSYTGLKIKLSSNVLQQRHDKSSCGPISAEMVIYWLSQPAREWINRLSKYESTTLTFETADIKTVLTYEQVDIGRLLPASLQNLSQLYESEYKKVLEGIRLSHLEKLEKAKGDDDFWNNCENAGIQVVMHKMVIGDTIQDMKFHRDKWNIERIRETPEFKMLQESKKELNRNPSKIVFPVDELIVNNQYEYEDVDIYKLLTIKLKNTNIQNVKVIHPVDDLFSNSLSKALREELRYNTNSSRTLLIPYNLGLYHWVAIVLVINKHNEIMQAVYLDPLSSSRKDTRSIIENKLKNIYQNDTIELINKPIFIQPDNKSCGPLTIENFIAYLHNNTCERSLSHEEVNQIRLEQLRLAKTKPRFFQAFYPKQLANQTSVLSFEQQVALHSKPNVFTVNEKNDIAEFVRVFNSLTEAELKTLLSRGLKAKHDEDDDKAYLSQIRVAFYEIMSKAINTNDQACITKLMHICFRLDAMPFENLQKLNLETLHFRLEFLTLKAIASIIDLDFNKSSENLERFNKQVEESTQADKPLQEFNEEIQENQTTQPLVKPSNQLQNTANSQPVPNQAIASTSRRQKMMDKFSDLPEEIADVFSNSRLVNNPFNNFLVNKLPNVAYPFALVGLALSFPDYADLSSEATQTLLGQIGATIGVAGGIIGTSLAAQLKSSQEYRENKQKVSNELQKSDEERSDAAKQQLSHLRTGIKGYALFSTFHLILTGILAVGLTLMCFFLGFDIRLGFGILQIITTAAALIQATLISVEVWRLDGRQEQIRNIIAKDNDALIKLSKVKDILLNINNRSIRLLLRKNLNYLNNWLEQGLSADSLQTLTIHDDRLNNLFSESIDYLVINKIIQPSAALKLSATKRQCLEHDLIRDWLQKQQLLTAKSAIAPFLHVKDNKINLSNLNDELVIELIKEKIISPLETVRLTTDYIQTLSDKNSNIYKLIKNINSQLTTEQLLGLTEGQLTAINQSNMEELERGKLTQILQNANCQTIAYGSLFTEAKPATPSPIVLDIKSTPNTPEFKL